MKTLSIFAAAIASAVLPFAAIAQTAPPKVPTGIDVPGCLRYSLTSDNRVRQRCRADTDPRQMTDTSDPQSFVRSHDGGGAGGAGDGIGK